MTKKGRQKFCRMKIEKLFPEKVKLRKFSTESEKFSEIGGKSETGGNLKHRVLRGEWTPLTSKKTNAGIKLPRLYLAKFLYIFIFEYTCNAHENVGVCVEYPRSRLA